VRRLGILFALLALAAPEEKAPAPRDPAECAIRRIAPGMEPHRRLLHEIPPGATEMAEVAIDGSLRVEGRGEEPEKVEGGVRLRLEVRSGLPGEDGRVPITVRLLSWSLPEGDPSIQRMIESPLEGLKSSSVEAVVDRSGRLCSALWVEPEGPGREALESARAARWLLLPLLPPLPAKPVGVGARWEAVVRPPIPGVDLTQRAEVTLESIEKRAFRLRLRLTHAVPTGRLRLPDLPPGVVVGLTSFESAGGGTITVRPSRLVPEVDLRLETRVSTSILSPAGVRNPSGELTLTLRVRPTD
jgi:hypothetical protein